METLRLFCDVARYRSFSQAAAEHDLTQSAVSQRVNALEKKLGVKLIDRSVRPLSLTTAGEVFLGGARDLVERYDRLESRVSQVESGPSGHVEVDAIYSAGMDLLNRIRDAFETRYPRVKVDIHYKRPEEVYDAVRQERCDLGILSYPQRWREVGVIPLRDEVMAVFFRPGHALAGRAKVHASELGAWPMVAFELGLPVARRIRQYLRDHGVTPVIANTFDNIDTMASALDVAECFAILPRRPVKRQVDAGSLCMAELEPRLVRPLGVIYHRRPGVPRDFPPAVQAFVDFLLEHAGPAAELATPEPTAARPMVETFVGAGS